MTLDDGRSCVVDKGMIFSVSREVFHLRLLSKEHHGGFYSTRREDFLCKSQFWLKLSRRLLRNHKENFQIKSGTPEVETFVGFLGFLAV